MKTLSRLFLAMVLVLSFAAMQASAQGPAGAGAAAAAGGGSSSSHSYNPLKWIGKKAKPTEDPVANDEVDKRLETKLRAMRVLGADATLKDSCEKFLQRVDCLAALHASHDLALNFACVKSNVTGVRVGADTSGCRMPAGDKPLSLAKTIKLLKPDADAKGAAKGAEMVAKQELAEVGA